MKKSLWSVLMTMLTAFLLMASLGAAVASADCVPPYCPGPGPGPGPGPPPPTPPPSGNTNPASNVGPTGATLNGTVFPNGSDTTYYFQYGTNADYTGQIRMSAPGDPQTPPQDAGSGNGAVSVSANVTGLTPETLYHYRLVAINAGGTVNGNDQTFMTAMGTPPTATTEPASSVSSSTAVLNGTVNPNGIPTNYYFQYGTTTSYGKQTSTNSAGSGTSTIAVSTLASGLTPNTTYHFRIVAVSAGGTNNGSDLTFTTSSSPPPPRPGATTKPATNPQFHSARLNGTVNPHGAQTRYYFQYGTTTSYGSQTSSQSAGSGTSTVPVSIKLTGLRPGTWYHFRIVAVSAGGTTRDGDRSFRTKPTKSMVKLSLNRAVVSPQFNVPFVLSCVKGSQACGGTLTITYRGQAIGSTRFSLASQTTKTVSVHLNLVGQRLITTTGINVTVTARGQNNTVSKGFLLQRSAH